MGPEDFAGDGPTEPSALMREFAQNNREMYLALVDRGFTENQALQIIGHVIAAAFRSNS